MTVPFRSKPFLALLGMAAACGPSKPDDKAGGRAVTRDSAGIVIVSNGGPTWPAGKGWTISDSASIDIGGAGTQDADVSQVTGAVRLPDGRIAVASGFSNAIRYYDATGKPIGSIGRPGSGPGEFRALTGLWLGPADSVIAGDLMLMRLTVVDPTAGFGRNFSLGGQTGLQPGTGGQFGFAMPMGVLGDGSVVGMRLAFSLQNIPDGFYRDTIAIIHYGPDGVIRDTVGRFLGMEMNRVKLSMAGREMAAPSPVPMGRQTMAAALGDRLYLTENTSWEVEVRTPAGKLERLIRIDAPPVALTEADIALHKKEQVARMEAAPQMRGIPPQIREQILAGVTSAAYPKTMPWIGGLFPSSDGHLWVEEVVKPGVDRRQFAVLDRDGTFLGRVTMPPKFQVLGVYPDAVLGVSKDDDDVEHVQVHRIVR